MKYSHEYRPVNGSETQDKPIEAVVGIVEFKGRIFVAKQFGVYVLGEDDVFYPVQFAEAKE